MVCSSQRPFEAGRFHRGSAMSWRPRRGLSRSPCRVRWRARPRARGDRRAASARASSCSCACARTARAPSHGLHNRESGAHLDRPAEHRARSSQSPPRRERGASHLDSSGRGQRPHAHRLQLEQHGAVSDAGQKATAFVTIGQAPGGAAQPHSSLSPPALGARRRSGCRGQRPRAIRNIDFRRGTDGAGQVVVELNDPHTTVDVREEGGRIVVDFQNTRCRRPNEAARRHRLRDAGAARSTRCASNRDARLVVSAAAEYDQVAYQTDNLFTLELKPPTPKAAATTGVRSKP